MVDLDTHFARNIGQYNLDAAFLAIHGTYAEDGCLQGLLECAHIPYTHSGVMASSICMNKHIAAALLGSIGIAFPEYVTHRLTTQSIPKGLTSWPYVLKPIDDGSSVGVIMVTDPDNPPYADASLVGKDVMASRYIEGQELTVGIMNNKALGVLEIGNFGQIFEYYDKYESNERKFIYPANIPSEIAQKAIEYSELAHNFLGCSGITRVDLRYNQKDGGLYVLEINTNPGLSEKSMFPYLAECVGISFDQIVEYLMDEVKSHKHKKVTLTN